MKEIKVVIGKNFGDEGKGQTVHELCKGQSALVVRHNGGAQAGHTVEEGRFRFVFHQLGSGSLQGTPTYLSHTFLPDLLKIEEEMEAVDKVFLYASPECSCTVVYDVILNSLREELRGEKRHGSCGMGIYEAHLRSREEQYRLSLKDFAKAWEGGRSVAVKQIADRLDQIRREYTLPRVEKLKDEYPNGWDKDGIKYWSSLVEDENLLWNVAEEMCLNFKKYFILIDLSKLVGRYDRIIFENAQGLMLDEDNKEYYPNLTPSHTGLYNVVRILKGLPEECFRDMGHGSNGASKVKGTAGGVEIIYVTRTYVTRHGAGRLDYECEREEISSRIEDRTNLPNPWQSSLRFARHPSGEEFFQPILGDLEWLKAWEAWKDFYDGTALGKENGKSVTIRLNHLDETNNRVIFSDGDMDVERFEEVCRSKGFRLWKSERIPIDFI